MPVQVPILQRHKDEVLRGFETVPAGIARACANVDFARTTDIVFNLVSSKRPIDPELLAEGLGVRSEEVDKWIGKLFCSEEAVTREIVERFVLSVWK